MLAKFATYSFTNNDRYIVDTYNKYCDCVGIKDRYLKKEDNILKIFIPKTAEKYSAAIGTAKGYNNTNYLDSEAFNLVLHYCQDKVHKETGIYVSFLVSPTTVHYCSDWGCPKEGEECFYISATRNPKFAPSSEKYKHAVLRVFELLQEELSQATISVTAEDVKLFYLESSSSGQNG